MSQAIAFDTHKFVKNLTQNGFTAEQAEALANEQVALLNSNLSNKEDVALIRGDIEAQRLATKKDIEVVRKDIEALRQETQKDIEVVRKDIEALRQETQKDIEVLRQETKRDIALVQRDIEKIKSDFIKWMLVALLGHSGLIVSLVVALV